jgi:hypothetical protein
MRSSDIEHQQYSSWLVDGMAKRGLSGAELARLVKQNLPEGFQFTPSNISHYRAGRSLPRALVREVIQTIIEADGDRASDSPSAMPASSGAVSYHKGRSADNGGGGDRIQLEDLGSGLARIIIDQQLPWAAALEVIKLLKLPPSNH